MKMKKINLISKICFLVLISTIIISCQKVVYQKFASNDSYWAKTETIRSLPALSSDLDIDIAIIGGGYTGLSSAYHLAKMNPDLKIVVFEAKTLGSGASGRNGGMVLTSLLDNYTDIETFKWTYDLSVENIKFIDSLSKALNINCDLVLNGYCSWGILLSTHCFFLKATPR